MLPQDITTYKNFQKSMAVFPTFYIEKPKNNIGEYYSKLLSIFLWFHWEINRDSFITISNNKLISNVYEF